MALCAAALASCQKPPGAIVELRRSPDCGERGQAATAPAYGRPLVFIQAGDPQIGGWTTIADTKGRLVKLAHICNEIRPAFVVIVGDLVNDGPHAAELAAFDEALAEFRVPVKLIPGNHDDLATFRRKYGKDWHAFTQDNCEFVCVNSNLWAHLGASDETRKDVASQWAFMEQAMAEARRQGRSHIFLVMHHPPELVPLALKRLDGLTARYNVDAVLCGHIHRTTEHHHRGRPVFTVAGTGWAGDKRGFGYRLFKVYPDRIEQEYLTLDAPIDKARLGLASQATKPAAQSAR
ncbi:MAG: metallophosphoesterase [Phycisphaerae bacterium]